MRTCIVVLLILVFGSCTMQKRHYRKGWTINWKTERNSKDDIAKTKDTSQSKLLETSLSSTTDHLDLIIEEHKTYDTNSNLADTIHIENKQKQKNSVKKNTNLHPQKLNSEKSKIPFKISLKKPEKKEKSGEKFFYFLAFMTFIAGILAFLNVSPEIFSAIGVNSTSDAKIFTIIALSVFLILFIMFLVIGIKRRRDFKNKNNPNYVKPERLVKKEKRVKNNKELATVGIVNRTKLWLLFAGIIVALALASIFLIEYGIVLAIIAILPFFAIICIAILEFVRFKTNGKAYFRGEYDSEKFLNRQRKKSKKKKTN